MVNAHALQYCITVLSKQTILFHSVYMHRGFADVEFPGRGAYRGLVLYDVQGQLTGPLFHVSFHTATSPP